MSLPQILCKNKITIPAVKEKSEVVVTPAQEEKVYDKYWITQLSIVASSPNEDAKMIAVLVPCRDVDDTKELMEDGEHETIVVRDLFARMSKDTELAFLISDVIEKVIDMGKEQGIVKE